MLLTMKLPQELLWCSVTKDVLKIVGNGGHLGMNTRHTLFYETVN